MASKGMIQVSGTTYRIASYAGTQYVFRVLDDAPVGSFRHDPVLEVVDTRIGDSRLLDVARMALRQGRLDWTPKNLIAPDYLRRLTLGLSVLRKRLFAAFAVTAAHTFEPLTAQPGPAHRR